MFCHFDVSLEKALGPSPQLQLFQGESRPSLVTKVAEPVSRGGIRAVFLLGRQEAGSLQHIPGKLAVACPVFWVAFGGFRPVPTSLQLAAPGPQVHVCLLALDIAATPKGADS